MTPDERTAALKRWLLILTVPTIAYMVGGAYGLVMTVGISFFAAVIVAAWQRQGSSEDRHRADSNDMGGGY